MAVAISVTGEITPNTIEQGQSASVAVSYGNFGADTGFSAQASLLVPAGFHIVSPNPTVLGDIGPTRSGNCTFTLNASEDLREGAHTITVEITCEERHILQRHKEHRFPIALTINLLESAKKKAARTAISTAEQSLNELQELILELQKAGGTTDVVNLESNEFLRRLQRVKDLFSARAFDKVLADCDSIMLDSTQLRKSIEQQVLSFRNNALNAIKAADRARTQALWATQTLLANFAEMFASANGSCQEGRYSEAVKMANAAILLLPKKPFAVSIKESWTRLTSRRRTMGLILALLGFLSTVILLVLAVYGMIPVLSLIPSLSIALIGLGVALRRG